MSFKGYCKKCDGMRIVTFVYSFPGNNTIKCDKCGGRIARKNMSKRFLEYIKSGVVNRDL